MKYYCKIYLLRTEEVDVEAADYSEAKIKALDAYANNQTCTCDEEIDEVAITQEG